VRERSVRAPGMHQRIADGIRRGKVVSQHCGKDLFELPYYSDLAPRPVDEVREILGMPPKSAGALEGGSAGLFDPDGMSDMQRKFAAGRRAGGTDR
jgi:hypothetical protein